MATAEMFTPPPRSPLTLLTLKADHPHFDECPLAHRMALRRHPALGDALTLLSHDYVTTSSTSRLPRPLKLFRHGTCRAGVGQEAENARSLGRAP